MNLEELRAKIDGIDDTLVQAFLQRMEVVAQVAQEKKAQGLPTLDPAREREKLADIAAKLPPELAQYGYALWSMLFEISRGYQHAVNPQPSALRKEIESAMESTPNLFPPSATVACQGVEGAYSQLACEKMFKHPQVMYFGSFESVFSAIENGFCDYGVLPLENSTAGSVKQIYDLMLRHSSFKIVRSTRLKVDHNLVAKKGTKLEDIKEIFSHPQAISQCTAFLEKLGKEKNYFESASCAFEGLDKEYTYNGFVLKTYPLNDVDYVASITLQDDTVATPEGIAIGSELADVTAAYGDSSSDTKCEYVKGDSQLLILLENGVVTSIQYVAITE